MDFSFVKISGELTKAICSTLIHSLWQGLLLAVFAGIVVIFTRKSTAKFRYNLLLGGMIVFCCAIASTFYVQLVKGRADMANVLLVEKHYAAPFQSRSTGNQQLLGFLTDHANIIVLVWFLIVLARAIQLMTGLYGVYELRKKAVYQISEVIKLRVVQLAKELGINSKVAIAESALTKVPMVIGHLKPLILIPIGLLTALPPSAIDAILVHELAHIHRRDYLVNLLLNLLEVVFFFNPAVLWLASLIKQEREHCCDDIAITKTPCKTDYIKALIACQEFNSVNTYAMALSGRKKHLLGRVSRMLSKNNQSLNLIEKSLLGICLVVAGLLTLAFANVEKVNKLATQNPLQVKRATQGTEAQGSAIEVNKMMSVFTVKNINITTLDTTKCEIYLPDPIEEYASVLVKNADSKTQLLKQNGILYQINSKENIGSLQVNGSTIPVSQHQRYTTIIDSLEQVKKMLPKLAPLNTRRDYIVNRQHYQADSAKQYKKAYQDYQPKKLSPLPNLKEYKVKPDTGQISISAKNAGNLVKQLTEAMLQDDVAKDDIRSFKLTENELIVNGKRIPQDTFKAFVNKNIGYFHNGATVYYNFDTKTVVN